MPLSLATIGYTIGVIGEILIAYTVLRIHHRFLQEQMVDAKVLKEMKREQVVAGFAIAFIVAGYLIKIIAIEFAL